MSIFIAGPVRPLNSVIKSQVCLEGPLQISRFFSVARTHVHVRRDVREASHARYTCLHHTVHANPVSKCGAPATLASNTHVSKPLSSP